MGAFVGVRLLNRSTFQGVRLKEYVSFENVCLLEQLGEIAVDDFALAVHNSERRRGHPQVAVPRPHTHAGAVGEEEGGVRSRLGAARTILFFHTITPLVLLALSTCWLPAGSTDRSSCRTLALLLSQR